MFSFGGYAQEYDARLLAKYDLQALETMRQQEPEQLAMLTYALDNAMYIAERMQEAGLPVIYPGLESHPDHHTAAAQMEGFGGVVSFEVAGDLRTTGDFIDRLRIPYIAPSLGGVESLIEQPALMSYFELTTEERLELGIKDNLVRFAVGIENTEDILDDLERALAAVPGPHTSVYRLEDIWELRFRQ